MFEETGGSYPELITRHDIKLFLPPIGGLTVYIFGDPAKMADPNVRLALRVHDECNGSDVFGSDICTCRPYLIFGVEEAVKEAQKGGSGVVIYFRKEGRALGEVTKYLVYNARKRGEDRASEYFKRTENIAGVKDMRFQALMPDVSHWPAYTLPCLAMYRLTVTPHRFYTGLASQRLIACSACPSTSRTFFPICNFQVLLAYADCNGADDCVA